MKNYIIPEIKVSMFEQVISTTEVAPSYVDAMADPAQNTIVRKFYNIDYQKITETTLSFQ